MKRRITALLLTISLLFSFAVIFASAETAKLGDVNNDGKITASDARTILRASAKLEEITDAQKKVADVDFNGRVSAADARLILRVSAKLDSFQEAPSETTTKTEETTTNEEVTTNTPETTTKAEETTKKPETTTKTEETTLPVLDEGTVVTEYPEAIDAFFSGSFYLNGKIVDGANSMSLKMATSKQGSEISFTMPGTELDVSIYAKGKETYLKLASGTKKHYVELTDTFKDEFSDITSQLTLLKISNPGDPILTKGVFTDPETNETIDCDIYTFTGDESSGVKFYAVEDTIIQISIVDSNDVAMNIAVKELSAKAPSDMLTIKGYSKTTILFIPTLYPEFSGNI